MKYFLSLLLSGFLFTANAQQHKLEMIWQTDSVIAVPESILPDSKSGTLYVSLINGAPWEADGKGGVGKLSADGKSFDSTWITGLSAPKGMGIVGNHLYVADINTVVVIDVKKGTIEKKIVVDSAQGLNDVTVDNNGVVYVSDSKTGKVHKIENGAATVYLNDQNGVNGLKAINNDLYILAGKSFVKADAQRNITKVADLEQGGDGIEPVGNGDFIVTSWGGWIWYVTADGKVETLLDTHLEKKNTADIGYDPTKRIIYVPTFNAKTVVAYLLK